MLKENSVDIIPFEQVAERLNLRSSFSKKLLRAGFRFLKVDAFNAAYHSLQHLTGKDFVDAAQDYLNFRIDFNNKDLSNIPKTGPFIIVSNHPHGIIDGLLVFKVVSQVRTDFKFVVNDLLNRIKPLQDHFLPVTKFSKKNTAYTDVKRILHALKEGTALVFFPAGSVAHFQLKKLQVTDKPWDTSSIKLIQMSKLPVVPVFIHGRASCMYHVLYMINKKVSLIWLIRELFNKKNKTLHLRIGEPILSSEGDEIQYGSKLREAVYALKS